jgi:hypothetical protein
MMLGFYLFTEVAQNQNEINPLLIKGLGIICVLFFGAIIVSRIARSLKKNDCLNRENEIIKANQDL